ncbi:Transcription factor [Rhizina undulata]
MIAEISKSRLLARAPQSIPTTGTMLMAQIEPKPPSRKLKDQVLAILCDSGREQDTNINGVLPWEYGKLLKCFEKKPPTSLSSSTFSCSISYNASLHRLIVHCSPGPVHEAFIEAMGEEMVEMRIRGFLNKEMRFAFGANRGLNCFKRKYRNCDKTPDWYIRHKDRQFPTVIFEVGFSQPYKDLVDNVKLWLEGSNGAVRLVVIEPASSPEPTSEIDSVKIVEVFIELWQYNPQTSAAVLRDTRVPVLPLPAATSYKILLGDILPPELIPKGRNAADAYNIFLSNFKDLLEEALPEQD